MDFKLPTVGRIVHFFPNETDKVARQNSANHIPAIVVQTWDNDMANLKIFPFGPFEPGMDLRGSVHHKSVASEGLSYWDWPEIK